MKYFCLITPIRSDSNRLVFS